jgi:protein TonB
MKTLRFWIAVVLSAALHVVPFIVVALWVPFTAAELLQPEGNSDREGFDVEAIALNPGAWKQGDKNTPGGDDLPLIIPEALKAEEKPLPVEAQPETPPPVPLPALVSVQDKPKETTQPTASTTGTRGEQPKTNGLPGASGGANMPIGTPSRGGAVGVPRGTGRIGRSKPVYPAEAVRLELEGRPIIWLRVSAEGLVVEAKVQKPCKHDLLNEAALRWARTLRFHPTLRGNEPVESTYELPVRFRLDDYEAD